MNSNSSEINYENELNEEQYNAVKTYDGPLLVLAGAGTGKTRVITYRIAYLIDIVKIDPYRILAVTFTNKASEEMKTRLSGLIGDIGNKVWTGTFHSIALRILRRDGEHIGLKRGFSVVDQDDRMSMIRSIIKSFGIDPKKYPAKMYLSKISDYKNSMEFVDNFGISDESLLNFEKVFEAYQEKMLMSNVIDFDDMLSLTIRLFKTNPEISDYYRNLFQYVLVDEYQDTNSIQFVFLNILSGSNGNLCVVGDDDQSIYGWRGAEIRNILDFDKSYNNVNVVKLVQNYRSAPNIIFSSNSLISCNRHRKDKQLQPVIDEMGHIKLYEYYDGQHEADNVVSQINAILGKGISPDDIAILYRTNAQSRSFEVTLNRVGIHYKVIGGIGFYQRREIKDILAYLKIFNNRFDAQSFERSLRVPARGIGIATIDKIIKYASMKGIDIVKAAFEMSSTMSTRQKKGMLEYLEVFKGLETVSNIPEMIKKVVELANYEEYVKRNEEKRDAEARLNNIEELVNAAAEFEEKNQEILLSDFLASTTLQTSSDEATQESVKLMTIHSAKGLEFYAVFLTGLEDGLFPLFRAYEDDTGMELEEERRLCYVGMTRAKRRLHVSYAQSRMVYGRWQNSKKSLFLHEMNIIEKKDDASTKNQNRSNRNVNPVDDKAFKDGSKVFHKKFGEGLVIGSSGTGEEAKIDIFFKTSGLKKIIARFIQKI